MQPMPILHFGPFHLADPDDGLWRGPHRCKLKAKAVAVLRYLVQHPGRLARKTDLLAAVWPDVHVSEWVLTTCIREIRQVLGDVATAPHYIATVHRQGYRFIAPVTVAVAPPPLPAPLPEGPSATPPPAVLAEEYKLVTLLCGAVVEAPALAARLGPERWYRWLQTVVGLAQDVLHHYDGTLLPPTSEGFTAVFGAPVAQEDHARRAVLAALELRQRLRDTLCEPRPKGDLAVGMGLHSGLVVVAGLGEDPQRSTTAVGAPVHLALRLLQQAAPGTILLSTATYALVHAEVRAAPCGTFVMDGSPAPVPMYTLQGLVGRHAGVVGRGPRVQSPFVGRERELALLHDRLAAASTGQGQVVGLVGEPGMGKTRLLREFCRSLAGQAVTVYVGQCLSYGQVIPYLPVRAILWQVCGLVEGEEATVHTATVQRRLQESGVTAEVDVALLLSLLDLPVAPACLVPLSPPARQARTFALLRHLVLYAVQRQPLVLVVENLHWSDATSAAWLASLAERLADAAVLLLGTYRPGYQSAWGAHAAVTQVALAPLQAWDSQAVVQAVLGSVHLPEAWLRKIVVQAAGNPFFLEELAWHIREQGGTDTRGAVPETVHAVLAARIDRLPPEAKHLVQVAAVIGHTIPLPLLQAVTEVPEETLQYSLAHLQAAEFLYETRVVPELTYTLKHALTHEVAYQSLLASTRQHYHQRIAQVVETRFPETVATQPAMLAHHYTEAGCYAQAISYWQRAGQQAIERLSYVEAVALFTKGVELVETLPDTPERARQELFMLIILIRVLMLTKGYGAPEVAHTLARARALCQQGEDTAEHCFVQIGLQTVALARAELQTARVLSEDLLQIARRQQEPVLCAKSSIAAGETCLFLGELWAARTHLEHGIACDIPQGQAALDMRFGLSVVGVTCQAALAWTLWLLGYPEQAVSRVQAAYALAEQLAHPASLGYALDFTVGLHQLCREVQIVQERAEELRTLARTQEFSPLIAWSTALHGWACAVQGRTTTQIAQICEGLAAWRATGMELTRPWFLALIAEAYGQAGQAEEGLAVLTEALTLVEKTDERWYEAELYRLQGELLGQARARHRVDEVERCFLQALSIARSQQAKAWELRTAISLGRLWKRQGQRAAARQLLAEVYGWFTEGFDTADLQDAKALLEELEA